MLTWLMTILPAGRCNVGYVLAFNFFVLGLEQSKEKCNAQNTSFHTQNMGHSSQNQLA